MTIPTREELDELEKLENAASSGPWRKELLELAPGGPMVLGVGAPLRAVFIVNGLQESPVGMRDATFMAALRNVAPALIRAARELHDLRSAIVFDVRDTYTRRSIGMSDQEVFEKWLSGVEERGWKGSDGKR